MSYFAKKKEVEKWLKELINMHTKLQHFQEKNVVELHWCTIERIQEREKRIREREIEKLRL